MCFGLQSGLVETCIVQTYSQQQVSFKLYEYKPCQLIPLFSIESKTFHKYRSGEYTILHCTYVRV